MVEVLQRNAEEELELLDVSSRGPVQLGSREGITGVLGCEENRRQGASQLSCH